MYNQLPISTSILRSIWVYGWRFRDIRWFFWISKAPRTEQGDTDAYDELYDYFMDSLMNDAEVVETLYGAGPYSDEFPISICKYGPLYYISALGFDLMGTYDSLKKAASSAESEFFKYINQLEERKKEQERKQERKQEK